MRYFGLPLPLLSSLPTPHCLLDPKQPRSPTLNMLTVAPSLCALVYGALLAAASTGITYPLVKQRIPSALAERAGSGASLTIDPPQYAYTTDIGIGKATYKVVVATGTPQTTLGKSANYRGGKDTGRKGKGALSGGLNYTVNVYEDTIAVGGISAMAAVGATDQMEVILNDRGTATHPVGIFGLAPDSPLGFSAIDQSLKPFVSTSNTAFAIDLAANTLSFGDSFSPGFWLPLPTKGNVWNVDGTMDGIYNFEAAAIESASDTISVDLAVSATASICRGTTADLLFRAHPVGKEDLCRQEAQRDDEDDQPRPSTRRRRRLRAWWSFLYAWFRRRQDHALRGQGDGSPRGEPVLVRRTGNAA
ncbi:hypothetical protein BDZ90DRAFT_88595 [Jaminaea rosea]|uniref:Acid protease n=1 Tax=Jaminaea rosea TaxID=1569628 RepID=A0A316UP20_9BASI|nr:hypothetical protein BDZ90DRAFT_88595 [Jaminaea rosea]PWN24915.1 hypothetical protein BDZ90DRAFT_88595 [Jaminaea rosea]